MSLTSEQYLALSQLSYDDLSPSMNGQTLGQILGATPPVTPSLNSDMRSALSSLSNWTLVNTQLNTDSGFSGLALQAPSTNPLQPGEIVFAFRGTEADSSESLTTIVQDIYTDLQLALPGAPIGQPNQFRDAYDFVKETVEATAGSSLSDTQLSDYVTLNNTQFTGHSLGGGLVQYVVYALEAGSGTTFNGVGIAQALGVLDLSEYEGMITDYVNADDIIGAKLEQPMRLMKRVTIDSEHLRAKNAFLRVRDQGDKVTLTYKQFDELSINGAKEIEVTVDDFDRTVKLLAAAGLPHGSFQETKRESWKLGSTEIVLDLWPWLNPYIEIEGQTEDDVKAVANLLDFDWSEAVFGDVMEAYRIQYPHIDKHDTVGNAAEVKFGHPLPEFLKK